MSAHDSSPVETKKQKNPNAGNRNVSLHVVVRESGALNSRFNQFRFRENSPLLPINPERIFPIRTKQ
jgi:hypothetical protein